MHEAPDRDRHPFTLTLATDTPGLIPPRSCMAAEQVPLMRGHAESSSATDPVTQPHAHDIRVADNTLERPRGWALLRDLPDPRGGHAIRSADAAVHQCLGTQRLPLRNEPPTAARAIAIATPTAAPTDRPEMVCRHARARPVVKHHPIHRQEASRMDRHDCGGLPVGAEYSIARPQVAPASDAGRRQRLTLHVSRSAHPMTFGSRFAKRHHGRPPVEAPRPHLPPAPAQDLRLPRLGAVEAFEEPGLAPREQMDHESQRIGVEEPDRLDDLARERRRIDAGRGDQWTGSWAGWPRSPDAGPSITVELTIPKISAIWLHVCPTAPMCRHGNVNVRSPHAAHISRTTARSPSNDTTIVAWGRAPSAAGVASVIIGLPSSIAGRGHLMPPSAPA